MSNQPHSNLRRGDMYFEEPEWVLIFKEEAEDDPEFRASWIVFCNERRYPLDEDCDHHPIRCLVLPRELIT